MIFNATVLNTKSKHWVVNHVFASERSSVNSQVRRESFGKWQIVLGFAKIKWLCAIARESIAQVVGLFILGQHERKKLVGGTIDIVAYKDMRIVGIRAS
jgi:hypothetical protein